MDKKLNLSGLRAELKKLLDGKDDYTRLLKEIDGVYQVICNRPKSAEYDG